MLSVFKNNETLEYSVLHNISHILSRVAHMSLTIVFWLFSAFLIVTLVCLLDKSSWAWIKFKLQSTFFWFTFRNGCLNGEKQVLWIRSKIMSLTFINLPWFGLTELKFKMYLITIFYDIYKMFFCFLDFLLKVFIILVINTPQF